MTGNISGHIVRLKKWIQLFCQAFRVAAVCCVHGIMADDKKIISAEINEQEKMLG